MSALEGFDAQLRDRFLSLGADEEALSELAAVLELPAPSGAEALVDQVLARHKEPTLLHELVRRWRDQAELGALLEEWESDANVQDDWLEVASARDLQQAKAWYVLADRAGTDDPKRTARLLRKLSRALADHPDNASGEYEIYGPVRATERLGNGETATVYKGVHLESGETVAVKVLKPSAAANPQLVDVLVAATEQVVGLRHPQIATVRQAVSPDDRPRSRPFYVLEYADGGTLDDRIAEPAFGRLERQRAAVRLCQGLAYAHRRGLVHGNLKPSNVLLTSTGETRLTDFLVARQQDGAAAEVVKRLASPYYTGPEVVGGQTPSRRSDIFSLGRLLFRLFTSKEENLYEVMVPQLFKQELEAHLSEFPDLIAVLERCTALDPEHRPENVGAVLAELHRYGGRLGADPDEDVAALRAAGDWTGLIEAQRTALLPRPPEEQIVALESIASVQEYVLGDMQGALETWAQSFRTGAARAGRTIEAELDRLRTDLDTAEAARVEAEAVVAVLDWGGLEAQDETLRLKLKAAGLFHHEVEDFRSAIPLYLEALQLDATSEVAYSALDVLYQSESDWGGLVALLERRLETRTDETEREQLLQRIARTEEERIGDLVAAAETWARLHNLSPAHEAAFANLDRLCRSLERWDDLAELLEDELARVEEPARLTELRYGLGQVLETHLDRPTDAVGLYATILADDPDHAPTIAALEGLMAADVEALAAARLLEPIYRRREEPSKLAGTLEVLLRDVAPSDDAWVATLEEIAAIRETHEAAPDDAFDAFARLHKGRPEITRVWDELERLAPRGAEPRWPEVVALFEETIEGEQQKPEPDASFVVSLWQRIGEIQIQHLYDFEAGIRAYRAVLELAPKHADALAKLELLYDETERWRELIDILDIQKQIHFESEALEKGVALMHRIAALYEEQLADPDRGIQTYAAALSIAAQDEVSVAQLERLSHDPAHTATVLDILDPHYTGLEDWSSLQSLLERGLSLVTGRKPRVRADTLLRMAGLAEHRQGDREAAFGYLVRAVREDVERDATHAELERVTDAIGAWERLVAFHRELLESDLPLSEERRQQLLFRMATWQRDRLMALDDAEHSFRAVLAINPEHRPALDALDELYTDREQHAELYEILATKAALAEAEPQKKVVLFRMARLSDEQLGDLDRAITAYDRIVALGEPDPAALDGLASIYERRADHARLLETLRLRASVEPDPVARIGLLMRLGKLAREALDDSATALEAFEEALALEPADPRPILDALADLYLGRQDLAAWYALLPSRLEVATSDAERVAYHLQAAELAGRPEAPEEADATGHYEAILSVEPYRPDVLLALEDVYARQSRWADLDDVYRRQFIGIHLKAATLASDQLDARDKAIEHLRKASELDPDRLEILDRLRALYEDAGAWDEVVALVERKLTLLDDPAEQGALLDALSMALEKNGQQSRALDAAVGALEINATDVNAVARLARLAVLEDRVDELLPDVVARVKAAGGGAAMKPLLAGLERLVGASAAMEVGDTERGTKELLAALKVQNLAPELALELMQPLFEHHGERAAMVAAMARFIEKPGGDPERRRAVYRATAELSEAQGDLEAAWDAIGRYFDEQPEQPDARSELLRLGEALDRGDEAVERLEARLDKGLADNALAVELHLLLGRLFEGSGAAAAETQPDRAISQFRAVLELEPEHTEALEALDRLYAGLQAWEGLREVLERRAALAAGDARVELTLRLATLLRDHFDAPGQVAALAIEVLEHAGDGERESRAAARRMLEGLAESHAKPGDGLFFTVADVLEAEYARTRRRDALLALLERALELLPADAAPAELHRRLHAHARAAAELNEVDKALVSIGETVRLRPDDRDAHTLLVSLTERAGAWEGLVTLYLELLAREDLAPDLSLELALQAARWLEERLDRPEDAVEAYRFALQLDEAQPDAMTALERLYLELGRLDDLYELLLARADRTTEDDARRLLLERSANLARTELGRPESAIACYRRVLEEFGPDTTLLERLRDLYLEIGEAEPLYDVMVLQLADAEESAPDEAAPLRLALGELAWDDLGDAGRAIPHLSGALADDTTHDQALTLLATVLEATGQYNELVDRLQTQLPLTGSHEVRLSLALRGARVAEEQLSDVPAAVSLYEEAREVQPDHSDATTSLYRLLEESYQWAELLANLETDLGRVEEPAAKIELALRIAELAKSPEKLGDHTLAAHYLGVALELDPTNLRATHMLVDLHVAQERTQEAVALLGNVLAQTSDPAARVELLLRRGDLFLEHLDLEDAASRDFHEAFQLDPRSTDAADRLAKLLTRQQAWGDLLALYAELVDRVDGVDEKVQVALRVADLVAQYDLSREPLVAVLEKTLSAEPPYPLNIQLILRLIAAYQELGNLPAASAFVERGLQDPDGTSNRAFQAELWYYKGLIAQSRGDRDAALEAHDTSYQLDNGHVPNLIAFGHLLYQSERWDDAVRILQVALLKQAALSPEQKVDVYYMIGMTWVRKGDRRRARDMFNRVLGLNREHPATLEALEELG